MQYSEKFGFFLPSRDVGDYADINQISYNFRLIDENVPKKNEVEEAIQSSVDQTADSESRKAQSGVAVMQAIQSNIDQTGDPTSPRAQSGVAVAMAVDALIKTRTDQTYSPTSENAQSGIAVAEAIASIPTGGGEKEWELIEDITLTEDVVSIQLPTEKINAKKEVHIEGYIISTDKTVTSQPFSFHDGSPLWQVSVNCKALGYAFLLMDIYKSPSNQTIFDGTMSVYNYALSGGSYKIAKLNAALSEGNGNLIYNDNLAFRSSANNPISAGTRFKVWGR